MVRSRLTCWCRDLEAGSEAPPYRRSVESVHTGGVAESAGSLEGRVSEGVDKGVREV